MNKVDKMCANINAKLGLKERQVGSIGRYTDMTTNAIVKYANPYGGFIVLMTGTDKMLINFLHNYN